jgi:hypothetical protein
MEKLNEELALYLSDFYDAIEDDPEFIRRILNTKKRLREIDYCFDEDTDFLYQILDDNIKLHQICMLNKEEFYNYIYQHTGLDYSESLNL